MPRYISKPLAVTIAPWSSEGGDYQALMGQLVICDDAVSIGILDERGNPIFRFPDPIGFDLSRAEN